MSELLELERLNRSHTHIFNYFPSICDFLFESPTFMGKVVEAGILYRTNFETREQIIPTLTSSQSSRLFGEFPFLEPYLSSFSVDESLSFTRHLHQYTEVRSMFEHRQRSSRIRNQKFDVDLVEELNSFFDLTPYKTLDEIAKPFVSNGLMMYCFWNQVIPTPEDLDELIFDHFVRTSYNREIIHSDALTISSIGTNDLLVLEYTKADSSRHPGVLIESIYPKDAVDLSAFKDRQNCFSMVTVEKLASEYIRHRFEQKHPVLDTESYTYVPPVSKDRG